MLKQMRPSGSWSARIRSFMVAALLLTLPTLAFSATQWLVVAPGQTYTSGAPRGTVNVVTQVAGESFTVDEYAVNNSTWVNVAESTNYFTLNVTEPTSSLIISPNGTTLDSAFSFMRRSGINVTFIPTGGTGLYTLQTTGGSLTTDSVQIPVQVPHHFRFTVGGSGSFTAGVANTVTIQLEDISNNVCTGYHGTVGLSILRGDVNGGTRSHANITFANGVYSESMTFYFATYDLVFRINKSTNPISGNNDSANFRVADAGFQRLLILDPANQTLRSGDNAGGANGRTGQSISTASHTANSAFNLRIYAVDNYWNTVTSNATVNLDASNGDFSSTPTLSGGTVLTSVTLHTVNTAQGVTMTASFTGVTSNNDVVPLVAGSFFNFRVNSILTGPYTAGSNIPLTIVGLDVDGNTVTAVPADTTVTAISGSSIVAGPGSTLPWAASPAVISSSFSSGVYSGNLVVRKAGNNYDLRVYSASATPTILETAYDFTVNPSATTSAYKYSVVLPGQTWDPGVQTGGIWGVSGTPTARQAGTSFTATVRATDGFGNLLTGITHTVTASLLGSNLPDDEMVITPNPFTLVGSVATPQFTLTHSATDRQIHLTGTYTATSNSSIFTVYNTTLDHFSVTVPSSTTAGSTFTTQIRAEDQYFNPVSGYAGTVYISCPLLDYSSPTESVISVLGGTAPTLTYTATAYWTMASGFIAGTLNATTTIYRATTSTAGTIFVSTNANDRPGATTGNWGQSGNITVSVANPNQWFVLCPGQEYRPGGVDLWSGSFAGNGYNGLPVSQQRSEPFGVTVYVTDLYWNKANLATTYSVSLSPTDTSTIVPATGATSGGSRLLTVTLNPGGESQNYNIVAAATGGYTTYTTPNIPVFVVSSFDVTAPGGGPIPSEWIAGVPVLVSITAKKQNIPPLVADQFNGTALIYISGEGKDYDQGAGRTHAPLDPIQFTNGIWTGYITLYMAASGITSINVSVGTANGSGAVSKVYPNTPRKFQIIAPGMTRTNGINPVAAGGNYCGSTGQPLVQTAGTPFTQIDFYLCDDYWNQITSTAGTMTATLESTDPYPAMIINPGTTSLTASVSLTLGRLGYLNRFTLFTVGNSGTQKIKISGGGYTNFELGGGVYPVNDVPVKHADTTVYPHNFKAFKFQMPAGSFTAGVPRYITITAIDPYGNTLDSTNGASPFTGTVSQPFSVALGIEKGSMWPTSAGNITPYWNSGQWASNVYIYKKYANQTLTATYDFGQGNRSGSTATTFNVNENAYRRVIPIVSATMYTPDDANHGGGYYTGTYINNPPPDDPALYTNFGSPSAQTAGVPITIFRAYACDTYGNIVLSTNDLVHMSATDHYAGIPANQPINTSFGYADFSNLYSFHTRGNQTITVSDATITTMTAGTTPSIQVNPNSFFGLQTLAPGQVAIEGSGTTLAGLTIVGPIDSGTTYGSWYSGVTQETLTAGQTNVYYARPEFKGGYFSMTVQAADMFGNFVATNGYNVLLTSEDDNTGARPTSSGITQTLSNGKTFYDCTLIENSTQKLTATGPTVLSSYSKIRVVMTNETEFVIYINGEKDNSVHNPIIVNAYPNSFNVRVEVQYSVTHEIVGGKVTCKLEPILDIGTRAPAPRALGITFVDTESGVATLSNETYAGSGDIYIRVSNVDTSTPYPTPDSSALIRVLASAPTQINVWANVYNYIRDNQTYYQIEANKSARIFAQALDVNQNPIDGRELTMSIVNQDQTSSTLSAPEALIGGTITDDAGVTRQGTSYRTFYAGAQNLNHIIRATLDGVSADLNMLVTVTSNGGVYPNPFNPNRESTHIDYPLQTAAPVKVYVYTLFGDLVWHKEFPAGDLEGAHEGVNSILWNGKNDAGATVANGGYICVVKVNDQEKKRFKIGVFKE